MNAGYDHPPRAGAPGGAYAIRPYTGTHLNNSTGRKAPTSQQHQPGRKAPNTFRIMDSRTNYKNMLLVLLLILAGLAGAIAPQTAAAEDYFIWIGGVEITSENYTNISASGGFPAVQSGTVTYDPASERLTLNNATINTGGAAIFIRRQTTLVLQGSNTIITAFGAGIGIESMTKDIISPNITGSGNLTIHSTKRVGISSASDGLNITSCTLTVNGKIELPGGLTIRSSNVYVQGGPLKAGDISLSGCKIVHPADAASERIKGTPYYAVTSSSGEICTEVCISTGNQCHESPSTGPSTPTTFTFSPPEVILNAAGNSITVKLTCNKEFSCSTYDKPIWINAPSFYKYLSKEKDITISAQPNTGDNRRRDEIVFHTSLGPATLKVTQLGANTKPELTLDPKELKVDAKGGEHKVTLSSTITIDDNMAAEKLPNWITRCRYSFSDHAGKIVDINITFEPNTGPERTADVVIKTTKGDVTLKVTQAGGAKPEPEKPEVKLTLEPKELKVDADGGKKEVKLSSNQPCHITNIDAPNWLLVGGTSPGLEAIQKITIFIQPNPGPERTADAVFKTNRGDVTLKVTQAGGAKPEPKPEAKFTLEPKELKVETDGGKKEVKLSCNQAFELNKVTVPSWMERVPSSATSDEKSRVCAFNIQKNTGAERMGEIIFHTDKGDVTLKVTQAAGAKPEPTLTLSPDMLTFPTGGGKQTVNVKSDYGWDTKASAESASWMKLTTDVKTGKIVVEVTPNTSTKKRGATIGVVSSRRRIGHRTPITRHILVTQEAAKAVEPPVAATGISLNPAAMTMGSGGGTVGFNVYAGKGWTISGSPDWMHPDATRGSGTRLVIVRFDRNESGAERTGKLTVKSDDGKAERTFTLTQRAGQRKPTPSPGSTPSEEYDYDLALNPEEITVGPSDGAGSSISVATSRLWAGSTTEDWIRLESAVGRGNGTFTFRLAANPSKEMRHGTITVRTQQGMDELKVAIHQQGNDGSVVSPAEVKVSNVTLDPATLTVNGDLSTALISAIVSPDNARNKGLLWMSSNASVATVQVSTPKQSAALPQLRFAPDADDYALVTIVGKGKAVITAAASDGSGIVARCEVNVLSTVANTVPYAPQAKVYTVGPTLYLSLPTPEAVQVYTLAGTLYRTWQAPAGDTSLTLPAGTYIIKVGPLTEKVVVR